MIPETEDTLATLDEPSTDMHAAEPDMSLDVILDVPVTLSLEVGRTRMPIRTSDGFRPLRRSAARRARK